MCRNAHVKLNTQICACTYDNACTDAHLCTTIFPSRLLGGTASWWSLSNKSHSFLSFASSNPMLNAVYSHLIFTCGRQCECVFAYIHMHTYICVWDCLIFTCGQESVSVLAYTHMHTYMCVRLLDLHLYGCQYIYMCTFCAESFISIHMYTLEFTHMGFIVIWGGALWFWRVIKTIMTDYPYGLCCHLNLTVQMPAFICVRVSVRVRVRSIRRNMCIQICIHICVNVQCIANRSCTMYMPVPTHLHACI
jgi:hypothetical protein